MDSEQISAENVCGAMAEQSQIEALMRRVLYAVVVERLVKQLI